MTVGERIRNRRIELGLSQQELAKRMGYSDKTGVSKAETKGDNITTTKVDKFAQALNCSFEYLMGWEENSAAKSKGEIAADIITDPILLEYAEKLLKLSEEKRKQIYSLIDLLSQ